MFGLSGRSFWLRAVSVSPFLIGVLVPSVPASIVSVGEVLPQEAENWTTTVDGYIGKTGGNSASLIVSAGSRLSSRYGYLGYEPGATGAAVVAGEGSQWTSSGFLYVGCDGNGTLIVDGGGSIDSQGGFLGQGIGSIGTATVRGLGSKWKNGGSTTVGRSGTGALTVEFGGEMVSRFAWVGCEPDSIGTVTVRGPDSSWTSSGGLNLGREGAGTLVIENGGTVNSTGAYLGIYSGSSGAAIARGPNSKWTTEGDLYVGQYGSGSLTVEDGAEVSAWTLYAPLARLFGDGTINAQGAVLDADVLFDATHPTTAIVPFGDGGTLTVKAGAGSLGAGYKGAGSLTVTDGVAVECSYGYVGYQAGSNGNATVRGSGSKWVNRSGLYVGYEGTGTLTLQDGGEATANTLFASLEDLRGNGGISTDGAVLDTDLAFDAVHETEAVLSFGTGGTLTVAADGGDRGAGYKGTGTLTVSDGVAISGRYGYLGYHPGSEGDATIRGLGSKWTSLWNLYVGCKGKGTLTVENGGEVRGSSSAFLGYFEGSTGEATVRSPGSKWTSNGSLDVGYRGNGTLAVEDGAEILSDGGTVASYPGSNGSATITGPGSKWTSGDGLFVAGSGTGTLIVEAGGEVGSTKAILGSSFGSTGAATIRGQGSRWTNDGDFHVGVFGSGSLTVEDGGELTAGTLYASLDDLHGNGTIAARGAILDDNLAFDAAHPTEVTIPFGSGGVLTVKADGGSLGAGYRRNGSLTVTDGIAVAAEAGYVGYLSGSNGTVTVSGAGSRWTNGEDIEVGHYGQGTLAIAAGGEVSNETAYLGYYEESNGRAVVTGPGSKWTNNGKLRVGYAGTGMLTITAGGSVSADWLVVNERSLLAVDIGRQSRLDIGDGTGDCINNGTIRLVAAPVPPAGGEYSPIAAGIWTGTGTYQALGGTWDETTHVFTVSETLFGISGQAIRIDLSDCQRALIEDPATGRAAGISFLGKTGFGNSVDFTATALSPVEIAELDDLSAPQGFLLGGWDLTAAGSGYDPGDPVYLSLAIPSHLDRDEFTIWRFDGTDWADLAPYDLTCTGGYASFTTEGLGVFAIAVPEPSVVILLAVCLAVVASRRHPRAVA